MTNFRMTGCVLLLGLAITRVALAAPLAGSEWRPTEIGDNRISAGSEMFVRFGSEGRFEGNGGCNRFFGTYRLDDDRIVARPLGATQKACPDSIMASEARFLKALETAKRFARDRTMLSLTDDTGKTVIRLMQTDAD